jgi:hypothetical protein
MIAWAFFMVLEQIFKVMDWFYLLWMRLRGKDE